MKKLKQTIGPGYLADINDLIPLKKTLNKVGYYKKPDWGYTDAVDERLLSAVTDFQKDYDLVPDGIIKPDGPTEEKLQQVAADADRPKTPTGTQKYIWRTIGDNKVRSKHADRNGKVFDWDNPPEGGHPGEDYNCRCIAEPYDEKDGKKNKKRCEQLDLDLGLQVQIRAKAALAQYAASEKRKELLIEENKAWKSLMKTVAVELGMALVGEFARFIRIALPASGKLEIAINSYNNILDELERVEAEYNQAEEKMKEQDMAILEIDNEKKSRNCDLYKK